MDLNVRAFRVVQAALSEDQDSHTVIQKKAASRKGGLLGGPSRAKAMSSERRVEIARKASAARWKNQKASPR